MTEVIKKLMAPGQRDRRRVPPSAGAVSQDALESLRATLPQAGSRDTVQQQPGVNTPLELRRLRPHGDTIGEWMKQFETMPFEGTAA